jgi:hypothetical protein
MTQQALDESDSYWSVTHIRAVAMSILLVNPVLCRLG